MAAIKFSRSSGSIGVGLVALLGVLAVILLFFAVALIESGNVGVKKTLGKVKPQEVTPGLSLRIPG